MLILGLYKNIKLVLPHYRLTINIKDLKYRIYKSWSTFYELIYGNMINKLIE